MPRDSYKQLVQAVEPHNTDEQNAHPDPLKDWEGKYLWRKKATCLCGQPKCMNLSEIRNKKTGRVLYPIGSTCIKRFLPASYDTVFDDMTTCSCGKKKSQHYEKCDSCYLKMGIRVRGQYITHDQMDLSLMHWVLRKHIHYKEGDLKRWLNQYIKKTHRILNNRNK